MKRLNCLFILIFLFLSCRSNCDVIKGKIRNFDSDEKISSYDIFYETLNKDLKRVRRSSLNMIGSNFRLELSDEEKYLRFELVNYDFSKQDSFENPGLHYPVALYEQELLYDKEDYTDKNLDLFFTTPVILKKVSAHEIKILEKKKADFYITYFIKPGLKEEAFVFISKSGVDTINLFDISKKDVIQVNEKPLDDVNLELLKKNEDFSEDEEYLVTSLAFIRDGNDLKQYTAVAGKQMKF